MISELQKRFTWTATLSAWYGHEAAWVPFDDLKVAYEEALPYLKDLPEAVEICRKARNEKTRRQRIVSQLRNDVGIRHCCCTLNDYETQHDAQREAVERIRLFLDTFHRERGNLVLYGPSGTGKDHLLIASAIEVAQRYGVDSEWVNGQDLFAWVRASISGEHESEEDIVKRLTRARLLVISDPTPISGAVTEFQANVLYRIFDGRYREMRPTWASINVASRKELGERIGAPNADRLIHDAEAIFCNWPSYRKSRAQRTKTGHQ